MHEQSLILAGTPGGLATGQEDQAAIVQFNVKWICVRRSMLVELNPSPSHSSAAAVPADSCEAHGIQNDCGRVEASAGQDMTTPGFFQGTGMPDPGWWEALWPGPAKVLA
jgi:hypothetical protein